MHVNAHRDGLIKGSPAFLVGVASTLRHLRSYQVRIKVDDTVLEKDAVGIFVMNMPYGGGGMKFAPMPATTAVSSTYSSWRSSPDGI